MTVIVTTDGDDPVAVGVLDWQRNGMGGGTTVTDNGNGTITIGKERISRTYEGDGRITISGFRVTDWTASRISIR